MCNKEVSRFKVTRDDLQRRFLAQHSVVSWFNIVLNGCDIVPILQRCVALKTVVVNRSVCVTRNNLQ